jgi:Fe-S-cluster-containing dehydrogenase component
MSSLNHGYWKTMAELEAGGVAAGPAHDLPDDLGALEGPADAGDDGDVNAPVIDPLTRRNFGKLMGASMALAGVAGAGCHRYDREEIVPLSRRPEDMIPGVTEQYATAYDFVGHAQALVATSYEGRPIKIDGNPDHPFTGGGVDQATASHGGSTAFAQASILHLYDPDRSTSVAHAGKGATMDDVVAELAKLRTQDGKRIRVLSEASSSPTALALRQRLVDAMPGLMWHEWEPVSFDNEREGMKLAFGKVVRPLFHLDQCQTVVALDCDFFTEHPASLRYARDFARARRPEDAATRGWMNRLYAIESTYTPTGVMADHRLALRSDQILPVLLGIEAALTGGAAPSAQVLGEKRVVPFVKYLAEDLKKTSGKAVVLVGRKQPAIVHAVAARVNALIAGANLEYLEDPAPDRPTHVAAITQLVKDIGAQQVDTLIMIGGNPVYDAPADLAFGDALGKVANSIHLSEYKNETSLKATWHVPRAHYLEAWGDGLTWDGTYTLAQPLIAPMYGGLSTIELLALLLGEQTRADGLIQRSLEQVAGHPPWREAIHDGFVRKSQLATAQVTPAALPAITLTAAQQGPSNAGDGTLEVTFIPSSSTWDGRFANNAWLQETPDFLTKVTWDNVALIAPDTARGLGISSQKMIRIKVGDRSVDMPALVMPGQAKSSIAVVLGGGRTAAGQVGNKAGEYKGGGFDAYRLRTSSGVDIIGGGAVSKASGSYRIATTQDHHDIREGMGLADGPGGVGDGGAKAFIAKLVRETDVATYAKPDYDAEEELTYFHHHTADGKGERGYSLFEEKEYNGYKWGMSIDLGSCMGCNACVVACQSENNVPVVGKKQVMTNREMSWIRIDRYFKGSLDEPEVVSQPVTCQHCENAPCEQVCPVGATVHSSEGLNDMVYNRCVGTRYCLNNCPYRVRRFNFFNYHKEFADARNRVRKLLFNPDVTVRERGVMEKCTYCVQRIQGAKIKAKNERRTLQDGEIKTACQSACPTEAIVFGDLNDPKSRVTRRQGERRDYELLGELNDKPRTHFLARVRNPNPDLVRSSGSPS